MKPASSRPRFWQWLVVVSLMTNLTLLLALITWPPENVTIETGEAPTSVVGSAAIATESTWAAFANDNLLELGLRLRQSGFPASVVREVILARISERPASERIEARLALEKQNPQLTDELLRPQMAENGQLSADALFQRRYGDLPEEKARQLKRVIDDHAEVLQKWAQSPGRRTAAADDEHQLLEKEKTEDIARLLTPQEFFEYELRSSETARQMRRLLYGFDTTEAEFRELFPLFRELGFRGAPTPPSVTVPSRGQWGKILDPVFQTRIEQVLGPDRTADFRRATAVALKPSGSNRGP